MTATPDPMFSLSTEVVPPSQFAIDGVLYDLYDGRHLSPDKEARFNLYVRREANLSRLIDSSLSKGKSEQAKKLALAMRAIQIDLVKMMTNVPVEVIGKLSPPARAMIITTMLRLTPNVSKGNQPEEEIEEEEVKAALDEPIAPIVGDDEDREIEQALDADAAE